MGLDLVRRLVGRSRSSVYLGMSVSYHRSQESHSDIVVGQVVLGGVKDCWTLLQEPYGRVAGDTQQSPDLTRGMVVVNPQPFPIGVGPRADSAQAKLGCVHGVILLYTDTVTTPQACLSVRRGHLLWIGFLPRLEIRGVLIRVGILPRPNTNNVTSPACGVAAHLTIGPFVEVS